MKQIEALAPSLLHQDCDLSGLGFDDTSQLAPLDETLGQDRALEAIDFGVGIRREGYNLFLMGSTGLGKHRAIQQALARHRQNSRAPYDWCYIANFAEPHKPRILKLPAGRGRALREDLQQLVEDLLNTLPAAFHSAEYSERAEAINADFKAREEAIADDLGRKARDQGIALIRTPEGYSLTPQRDGHILSNEEFEGLPPDEQKRVEGALGRLKRELRASMRKLPIWQRARRKQFKTLDRETADETIRQLMSELQDGYRDLPEVEAYLAEVRKDVVDNHVLFRQPDGPEAQTISADDLQFNRYKVNLLVDNVVARGVPVVYEDNPTYPNLIGRIEHLSRNGTLLTDFTLIRPGALQQANGGYLVLDADKVLTAPFVWEALKRTLKAREIRIEALERRFGLLATVSLEPQAIPLDLKVILIGERNLYFLLSAYDPEFSQLFKVAADFSEDMDRSGKHDELFARFIATLEQGMALRSLHYRAVERIVEQAARLASDGDKLSLDVSGLLNLMHESDYLAAQADSELIQRQHVEQALDAQKRRVDQLRGLMQEQILRGTIMIDTDGAQLGRINALTVIASGEHPFGMPARISVTARLGGGELIDIQREVDQGGPIHSKGVFILSSYLARRYAKYQPLCLSASLAFEQTYGLIEGDSASTAELCALLSAIGDLPLSQSLAITGSVNQHGEVQAIGGVNEKIEGFFDICSARGLTGKQGVIIPAANQSQLMLRQDIVEAAGDGQFRVYAISHVDQAMQLLTGLDPGVADAEGAFPLESANGQVQLKLAEWFSLRQQLAGGGR